MFVRKPTITFDAPDDSGAEAPPAAEVQDSTQAPDAEPANEGGSPDGSAEDTPPADQPVDWEARVRDEWGGEDRVSRALRVDDALQTRDGVTALAWEALRALGVGDKAIESLFGGDQPADDGQETIEDLLADPDRVLTAAEIARVLEHRDTQREAKTAEERAFEEWKQTVDSTVDKALSDLKFDGDDETRQVVLTLGDKFLPVPGDVSKATPQQIAHAVRKGYDVWQGLVKAQAEAYVQSKADVHSKLPSPLPSGQGSGGEAPPEPQSIEEAKKAVRASLGI